MTIFLNNKITELYYFNILGKNILGCILEYRIIIYEYIWNICQQSDSSSANIFM